MQFPPAHSPIPYVIRAPLNASSNGSFETSLRRGCHRLIDITVRKVFMLRSLHFLFHSFILVAPNYLPLDRPAYRITAWPAPAPLCHRFFTQNGLLKMQPHATWLQLSDRSQELARSSATLCLASGLLVAKPGAHHHLLPLSLPAWAST